MNLFTIIVLLLLAATVYFLAAGLISMGRGEDYDRKHSGKFMLARIEFQAAAILLIILLLVFHRG